MHLVLSGACPAGERGVKRTTEENNAVKPLTSNVRIRTGRANGFSLSMSVVCNCGMIDAYFCIEKGNSMIFTITITRDEDGVYISECPAIPGCMSQGKTEAEAQQNIQDAIRQCLAVRNEMGMPLTIATKQVEVAV